MEKIKSNYNGIDWIKLLCAFLVVGIHAKPFAGYSVADELFGLVTRIPVPFFFAASSFFFFKGADLSKQKIIGYVRRMFILYLLWSLIYLAADICTKGISYKLFAGFLSDFVFAGYKHFWFLHASIVGMVIVYLLYRYIKNKRVVLIIAVMLYCTGTCFSTYSPVFSSVPFFNTIQNSWFFDVFGTRNGIFYAPVFLVIGSRFPSSVNTGMLKTLACIAASYVLLGIEGLVCVRVLNTPSTILWFSMIPLTYFVFMFALQVKINVSGAFVRKCSTVIYCIHPLFITVLNDIGINNMTKYIIVMLLSFGSAVILQYAKRLKIFKWLAFLQ